jgi:hypothetical protein
MKGISTRVTKLGFHILRLHYSADPEKDPATPNGKKWYEEARKGMSEARFRQEMELDYGALGGQLVFPNFDESIHVVEPRLPVEKTLVDATIWMACDPHPRTPHAFLWLAVNREGEMAVVWSDWQEKGNLLLVSEYAEWLTKKMEPEFKPHRRLMDVAGKSFNAAEDTDYFAAYRDARDENGNRCGVMFQPAKKNRNYNGYDLIQEAFRPVPFVVNGKTERRPKLVIWQDCGDNDELVYQLKTLRFREWKGTVDDKDAPEEPQEKRRHLIDCLSYILLDKPRFIEKRWPAQQEEDEYVVRATPRR